MSIFPLTSEASVLPVEGDGSFNEIFRNLSLEQLPKPKLGSVLSLKSDTSIAEASKILGESNILSAPIRDVTKPDDESWVSKYIGVADFLAIVDWMISKTAGAAPGDLYELQALKESFKTTPISELAYHARWSQFVPLDLEENTILDAMLILGKYGVHRAYVVKSPGGDIVNVITQQSILDIISHNLSSFAGFVDKPISALGLGKPTSMVQVHITDTFWDAFHKINMKCVSAVPVVDGHGKLVDNISSRDLRKMILDPVKFKQLNQTIGSVSHGRVMITCTPHDTLQSVIEKLQAHHVHRVYVVDSAGHPISVISIRDVIAQFVRESEDNSVQSYFAATVRASNDE